MDVEEDNTSQHDNRPQMDPKAADAAVHRTNPAVTAGSPPRPSLQAAPVVATTMNLSNSSSDKEEDDSDDSGWLRWQRGSFYLGYVSNSQHYHHFPKLIGEYFDLESWIKLKHVKIAWYQENVDQQSTVFNKFFLVVAVLSN
jgi:hypothetical protein